MLGREDIVEGIYLKRVAERSFPHDAPRGLIAVVQQVGADWTGEWSFQLRYLDQPGRTRQVWSLNLREKDLVDFELIGNWITAQALLECAPGSRNVKNALNIPARLPSRRPVRHRARRAWLKWHPNQLRLFDAF
ncbi:MAG: hypothetical protein KF722_09395 [Nitrospira sp.]|nr:hypothetical protein [Nitrospira sp.]